MPLQFGQVIERIDSAEFARVDQAHEDIPHMGAAASFIEKGILV